MTAASAPLVSGPLTGRQELFCRHYVLGTSAAAAARQAGYSEDSARTQAWRLLKQPAVQERIATLQMSARAAQRALCAQLWAKVEEIHARAMRVGDYGVGLRAVATQLRLYQTLGLPAEPADTDDLLAEAEEAAAEEVEEVGTVEEEVETAGEHPTPRHSGWSEAESRNPPALELAGAADPGALDLSALDPGSAAPARPGRGGEEREPGQDPTVSVLAQVLRGAFMTELERAGAQRRAGIQPIGDGRISDSRLRGGDAGWRPMLTNVDGC